MLVHDRPPPPGNDRRPVEPNWRVWSWVVVAVVLVLAAAKTAGLTSTVLVCSAFVAVCRAAMEAIPYAGGLREWHQ
jgi:hypothetical protein